MQERINEREREQLPFLEEKVRQITKLYTKKKKKKKNKNSSI